MKNKPKEDYKIIEIKKKIVEFAKKNDVESVRFYKKKLEEAKKNEN